MTASSVPQERGVGAWRGQRVRQFGRVAAPAVVLGVVVGLSSPVRAQKLVIAAPDRVVGDGVTPVVLTVTRARPAAGPDALAVDADAGTVEPGATGEASTFAFVPPRVVRERRVGITATARVGRRAVATTRVITVVPAPDEASEIRSGGVYDVRGPERIRLGSPGEFAISLSAAGGAVPELFANTGTLAAPVRAADGRWTAAYTPPSRRVPQVAIIAAVSADRSQIDWLAIPLHGSAEVELDSEPRARMTVAIGGARYGPVRTDDRGKARLWIAVPPGVIEARTRARDRVGNVEERTLALQPPPVQRVLAVCPGAAARVHAIAVTPSGEPLVTEALSITASRGAVDRAERRAPGVYQGIYRVPADAVTDEPISIVAALPDAAQPAGAAGPPGRCTDRIAGELPTRLDVGLGVPAFAAGSGETVEVVVQPVFAGRLPPLPIAVRLTAELGTVGPAKRHPDGRLVATWTLPDPFAGKRQATLTAQAYGVPGGVAQLALQAGPVSRLTVSAAADQLAADGRATTELRLAVVDRFGNPVYDASLEVVAHGRVGPLAAEGPGTYTARYTAAREPGDDRIVVRDRVSGAAGEVMIRLVGEPKRVSAALKVGYLSNTGKVAGPLLSVDAAYRLPVLAGAVAVGVDAGFYASADRAADVSAMETIDTDVVAASVLARVLAGRRLGSLSVYAGGGLGVVLGRVSLSSPSGGSRTLSRGLFAVNGTIGSDVALGPGRLLLEAAYLYASVGESFASGNLGGVYAQIGYRYEL